jgi:hypothetical protein
MIVSYSPGVPPESPQAERLFLQLDQACRSGTLKPPSAVLFNVPDSWPESARFQGLLRDLDRAGVRVLHSKVDPAWYGFVGTDGDPLSAPARKFKPDVLDCRVVKGAKIQGDVPKLGAKQLLRTLSDEFGADAVRSQLIVVGDEDSQVFQEKDSLLPQTTFKRVFLTSSRLVPGEKGEADEIGAWIAEQAAG